MLIAMDKDKLYDVLPQLSDMEFIKGKSEFIRLARQEGVQINREKIKEDDLNRILNNGDVIKIGKKRFVRIIKN